MLLEKERLEQPYKTITSEQINAVLNSSTVRAKLAESKVQPFFYATISELLVKMKIPNSVFCLFSPGLGIFTIHH